MKEKLMQAFGGLVDSTITAVPKVLVGIVLFIVALVVAKLVEKFLRYALMKVRFDELVGKAGIDLALQRLGIRQELTLLFPRLAYFLVLLVLARTAGDASVWWRYPAPSGRSSSICRIFWRPWCC